MTEDEMVGWHHQLDGHEFEQAAGVGDGQGSLAYCSPRGHNQSDMTEQLKTELKVIPSLLCGRRQGWDVSREQHLNMYIIQGETDHQPRLDA